MAEPKKLRAVEQGRTLDIPVPFDDDVTDGEWCEITVAGVTFRAHIRPEIGGPYRKAIDRVRNKHRIGKGRKPSDLGALPSIEQHDVVLDLTAGYLFDAYETPGGKPLSVMGVECSDTPQGRRQLLRARPIFEAVRAAIEEVTERAHEIEKEDAEQAERLEGN